MPLSDKNPNAITPLEKRPVAHPDKLPEAAKRRAREEEETHADDYVRPAGRKEMKIPPREWTKVDEESDESFPASDPPGNY